MITVKLKSGQVLRSRTRVLVGEFHGVKCWWHEFGETSLGVHEFADDTWMLSNAIKTAAPRLEFVDSLKVDRKEMLLVIRELAVGPRQAVMIRTGNMYWPPPGERRAALREFGPSRRPVPDRDVPTNRTGDEPLGSWYGLQTMGGDPWTHGGGGIETAGGWGQDTTYHHSAENAWWTRNPIWCLDRDTGRPSRLAKMEYDSNAHQIPWMRRPDAATWLQPPWGTHSIRYMRHGDRCMYLYRRPLSVLRAWMCAEEFSWALDFDQVYRYSTEHRGVHRPARELGWWAHSQARWIDAMRRGWYRPAGWLRALGGDALYQEQQRCRARAIEVLQLLRTRFTECGMIQAMEAEQWHEAFRGKSYVGCQAFEWPIFMIGVDALEQALEIPAALRLDFTPGCARLYAGRTYDYEYGTGLKGPAHYYLTQGSELIPLQHQEKCGDISHVLNGIAVAWWRGWKDGIRVSLRHHQPHPTGYARLAWCRQLQDLSFTGLYEGALEP